MHMDNTFSQVNLAKLPEISSVREMQKRNILLIITYRTLEVEKCINLEDILRLQLR